MEGFVFITDEFMRELEKIIEQKVESTLSQAVYNALIEFHSSKLLMSKKEVREKLGISAYKLEQLIEGGLLKTTPDGKKIYTQSFMDYVKPKNSDK